MYTCGLYHDPRKLSASPGKKYSHLNLNFTNLSLLKPTQLAIAYTLCLH